MIRWCSSLDVARKARWLVVVPSYSKHSDGYGIAAPAFSPSFCMFFLNRSDAMQGSTYPSACSNHSEVWSFHCFFWGKPTVMLRDVWTFNPMPRVSESCSKSDNFCRKFVKEQRFNQNFGLLHSLHHLYHLHRNIFQYIVRGLMFSSVYLPLFNIFNMIYIMYLYISNHVCIYIYLDTYSSLACYCF